MKKLVITILLVVSVALNIYLAIKEIDAKHENRNLEGELKSLRAEIAQIATEREILDKAFQNVGIYFKKDKGDVPNFRRAKALVTFGLATAFAEVTAEKKGLSPEQKEKLREKEGIAFAKQYMKD